MATLLQMSPEAFIRFLKQNKIRRFHFVFNFAENKVIPSHKVLQPIADFLMADQRDFDKHEGIFFQITNKHDALQAGFVHKTNRGNAAGGTRFWPYRSMEDFLRDGLRLSKGMTRKNALAGLWWGGGKGVVAQSENLDIHNQEQRRDIFKEYGELMSAIRGVYITAEDVGTNPQDIAHIFSETRFSTCIPPALGGSGNPSEPTATGVIRGMEAALRFMDGGTIEGRTIAIQGMGHVGEPLIRMLLEKGAKKIIACDIKQENIDFVLKSCGSDRLESSLVEIGDNSILFTECDVLAPCATGAILNPDTIPRLNTKIVCGAANNQLEDGLRDDDALFARGILYVPDFLVNRMGIVNCANEQYGYIPNDPYKLRHLETEWEHSIFHVTFKILQISREQGEPPAHTAIRLADVQAEHVHPIFGHRGLDIIKSLVEDKWFEE
ncbi:MAG: Glu/Leu/Phe/Val dehydrogenase [Calditrichaeota bacterium]|nr:MAG: Glu/Leu/Phe/Val dehydrogenase [Calditrichota bacterium]